MEVRDVPDPDDPRAGEVLLSPEAVGLCGSDFHFFLGDLDDPDAQPYPRIQGHEAAGVIEAVGPECPPDLRVGGRVALWPVLPCGRCRPCRVGRPNVCVDLSLIGIHRDGALQDRICVPATQVFPVDDLDATLATLVEPVSIAVHAVARGRVASDERVVVVGAGPIGQALAVAATDRGARVLLLDRVQSRIELGAVTGAEAVVLADSVDLGAAVRAWADDGPEVVFEATGAPGVTRSAIELVARGGRVVVVGLSGHTESIRVGELVFRELDILGVSCCTADEFVEAVALVTRRRDALSGLLTHEFPLEQTPDAITYAMRHPAEVMKAVIRVNAA
jgi:L-gulonate 5-dehydrogenase